MCGRGGRCMAGGHAWGVCMAWGGMHGGRCAWQWGCAWQGGVHGGGACVAGGHAWQILRDTVNEGAVRILLECILVIIIQQNSNET